MKEAIAGIEANNELDKIGAKVEGRIVRGVRELMTETERMNLRENVEMRGINLSALEGKTFDSKGKGVDAVTAAGDKLEKVMGGRDKLIDFLSTTIKATVSEERRDFVDDFLRGYFLLNVKEGESLVKYDLNSGSLFDARVVAIVSATHRLLKIVSAENQEEAMKLQTNDQTGKFLRERVLMGWEKAKMKKGDESVAILSEPLLQEEIARTEFENKTRSLPIGGVEVIINTLMGK